MNITLNCYTTNYSKVVSSILFNRHKTITYTFEEFKDKNKRKEVEDRHKKETIDKYLKLLGVTASILTTTIVTVGGAKYLAVAIPAKATINTVVACTSEVATVGKMEVFNEFVCDALNKMYTVVCLGGLTVESIQCNNNTSKKFGSCLSKYALCYGGGLFILYTLAEIKSFA